MEEKNGQAFASRDPAGASPLSFREGEPVVNNSSGSPLSEGEGERGRGGEARLAILLSGRGSNMLALAEAVRHGVLRGVAEVAVVFSNDPAAPGLAAAAARGLPVASLPSAGRQRAEYDQQVVALLRTCRADYVVLAGYLRVLSPGFVQAFAGRIVNIHPADTRLHQGLHAYEWAFANRLPETKITVHLVDEGLDTGPILAQQAVNLAGASTLADVQRRGLAVEHQLYPETLRQLITTPTQEQPLNS